VYLSRALEPWIRAGTYTGLPSLSMANLTLAYFAKTLYVTDRTNRTTLVYDTVQAGVERVVSRRDRRVAVPRRHR
jgi:hypothetical protein